MAVLIDILNEQKISYILPEYTGYSNDGRKMSSQEVLKNVHDTAKFIEEQGYENIYIIGQSIGTGAASYHAEIQKPERLLLISPFISLTKVVKGIFPIYPKVLIDRFLDDPFNNLERLKGYDGRLMVMHGTKDCVAALEQGKLLFDSIQTTDKEFVELERFKHSDVYNSEKVKNSIRQFIR